MLSNCRRFKEKFEILFLIEGLRIFIITFNWVFSALVTRLCYFAHVLIDWRNRWNMDTFSFKPHHRNIFSLCDLILEIDWFLERKWGEGEFNQVIIATIFEIFSHWSLRRKRIFIKRHWSILTLHCLIKLLLMRSH
jgi:hypothetical protein